MAKKKILRKKSKYHKFKKKDISHLRYGILHSQFGYSDGVSIVMKQIEHVMIKYMHIPGKNIFYLVGKAKQKSCQIEMAPDLVGDRTNQLMIKNFNKGFGGDISEEIEYAITRAKHVIHNFIKKHKIDVIIAHNTCYPANFIMSVALYRYYGDAVKNNESTPKYILWWHDSHLERKRFLHPANDVEQYLLQGVPGMYVEHIIFINSTQFNEARKYFLKLDKKKLGFFDAVSRNHDVIYNTTDTFIDSYDELESDKFSDRVERFIKDFKIRELLKRKNLTLSDVVFCLQHTRMVNRKRIDFAIKYCFELLKQKRITGKHTKAMYFLVSGHDADGTKKKLIKLHKKLCKEYKTSNLFLVFAEDFDGKTNIAFGEYPHIFAKLRGFATYFSEIEGFGNNLLEVMASGLIPVLYTYPVFVKDIAKQKFKVVALNKFEVDMDSIDELLDVLRRDRKRKRWVNHNLKILKRRFPHKIISFKLRRAITSPRSHK